MQKFIQKYRILEYESEKDCWIKNVSWSRDFYSARSLKECFSSKIKEHDVSISYLGMKQIPNVLKHAGLFNRLIAFVDNKTKKTYQFEEFKDVLHKYQVEDIAECIIRLCDENGISLTSRDVLLYCHYIKRWYSEHEIDIMYEDIENKMGLPRNKRLEDKIGNTGLIFSYIEHFEEGNERYFKVPLKDAVKYNQLKQEDQEIISSLLEVLTETNYFELLKQFRKDKQKPSSAFALG